MEYPISPSEKVAAASVTAEGFVKLRMDGSLYLCRSEKRFVFSSRREPVELSQGDALGLAELLKLSIRRFDGECIDVVRVGALDDGDENQAGVGVVGLGLGDSPNGAVCGGELLADGGCVHVDSLVGSPTVSAYLMKYLFKNIRASA